MLALFQTIILMALKDRFFVAVLGLYAIALSGAAFLGNGALVEKQETFAVFAGMVTRNASVLAALIYVAFTTQRLYETKEIETMLARPISREGFVLAYGGGMMMVALLLTVPIAILVAFVFAPVGAWLWIASAVFEMMIVVGIGVFASLTLQKAMPSVLSAVAIYLLARLISFFLAISDELMAKSDGAVLDNVFHMLIQAVSLLMPRLDFFGQTSWLVYGGAEGAFARLCIQTLVFVPLLLAATMFDMRRKRF